MAIPNRLIFIWFGREFPHANVLALTSARKQCRPEEILLMADHPDAVMQSLGIHAAWPELKILPPSPAWFADLPRGGELALRVFEKSGHAATRANLLRLALLHKVGGIYLDFDTITLKDLAPLRAGNGFFGLEPVVFPASFRVRKGPWKWIKAGLLLGLRELAARMPGGWQAFRIIEGLYAKAANNAVLGFEAGHPLLEACFSALASVPPGDLYRRFRLGTHLLQEITDNKSNPQYMAYPPEVFYPLGPEISNHWFRARTAARFDAMVSDQTFIVHWYNSVEKRFLKETLSQAWLRKHPDTAMAEMARRYC